MHMQMDECLYELQMQMNLKGVFGFSCCLTTLLFNRPFLKWRGCREDEDHRFSDSRRNGCPVINYIIISGFEIYFVLSKQN